MRYNIHCEKIYDDEVWKKLTTFLRKKGRKTHLFLMAPQPTYLKAVLGYRGSKEELVNKLTKRYAILAKVQSKYKFKVGLHIHLSLHPYSLTSEEKDQSIKHIYQWVSKCFNRDINNVSFGWFKYDLYIRRLCMENGIRIINDEWGAITLHDYDLHLTKGKIFEKWMRVVLRKLKGQKPKR